MNDIESKFKAESKSLRGVFEYGDAQTGFKIPAYQRRYNWGKEHICRLIEDIIENINDLVLDNNKNKKEIHSYTFLGAMIITEDTNHESGFKGNSYLVIDGQQRLTTLSLLACMLIEWLYINEIKLYDESKKSLKSTQTKIIYNLLEHFSDVREDLFRFCLGRLTYSREVINFPKIVRSDSNDYRSKDKTENEYDSDIAMLLRDFEIYFNNKERSNSDEKFDFDSIVLEDNRIHQNLGELRDIIEKLSNNEYKDQEENALYISKKDGNIFLNPNIKSILDLGASEEECKNLIETESKSDKKSFFNDYFFPFLRIYLFSKYLVNNVVMTIVECPDEHYALSIFEKINTTGEPLTALETFKSDIITLDKNDKRVDKNKATEIRQIFDDVEKYVDAYSGDRNSEKSLIKRRNVSSDIVLAFHQYYYSDQKEKGSKKLAAQRRIMKKFSDISDIDEQLNFVKALNDICVYRQKFWDNDEISNSDIDDDVAKTCLLYLKSMNKTLTIPLLAKLYANRGKTSKSGTFIQHVKSITAFTVLWRSYTVGTAGIDRRYRDFLSIDNDADIPKSLREELSELINRDKGKELKKLKERWITEVAEKNLYSQGGKNTAKFLILCAEEEKYNNKNRQDSHRSGYLNDLSWKSKLYETIEHIAPQKPQESDNDSENISNKDLKDTIGNLILLPKVANSSLSNIPWGEKKELYKALSQENKEKVREYCKNLCENKKFPKIIDGIEDYPVLPIIKELSEKEKWDSSEVEGRSREILKYVWDELYTWIQDY